MRTTVSLCLLLTLFCGNVLQCKAQKNETVDPFSKIVVTSRSALFKKQVKRDVPLYFLKMIEQDLGDFGVLFPEVRLEAGEHGQGLALRDGQYPIDDPADAGLAAGDERPGDHAARVGIDTESKPGHSDG